MENGIYRARALGALLGETKGKNIQVGVEFEFLDHPVRMTYFGSFSDAAMPITLKALRTAGWQGDDLADLSSIGGENAPEVSLVVENEEYEGKWRSKIKWVNAAGGVAMASPLAAEKAAAFAARMRGAVLAHNKAVGTRPASASKPTGDRRPEPPPNLDEPPF